MGIVGGPDDLRMGLNHEHALKNTAHETSGEVSIQKFEGTVKNRASPPHWPVVIPRHLEQDFISLLTYVAFHPCNMAQHFKSSTLLEGKRFGHLPGSSGQFKYAVEMSLILAAKIQ